VSSSIEEHELFNYECIATRLRIEHVTRLDRSLRFLFRSLCSNFFFCTKMNSKERKTQCYYHRTLWIIRCEQQTTSAWRTCRHDARCDRRRDEFVEHVSYLKENVSCIWWRNNIFEQNEKFERFDELLIEKAKSIREHEKLSKDFYSESYFVVTHILNRTSSLSLSWNSSLIFMQKLLKESIRNEIAHLKMFDR
jgi:hypothetical protein